jgi:cyclopropane fatty-acyl-phospholipid synthase-like methyltransferase
MADGSRPASPRSLEGIVSGLSPDAYYQSPGGRRFLIAAALLADLPHGARVLDVESGIGSGAVDLAEAFGAKVTAFDNYAPYLAFGRQNAAARGVGKSVQFKSLDGAEALNAIESGIFDVVLGLGGALTDTIPGGLEGGFAAAAKWCRPGGHLIAGELVTPSAPSDLMKHVFGGGLRSEGDFLSALEGAGFELVFSTRATSADWDDMRATMAKLRDRSLDLGPPDERQRQGLTEAARNHPEVAYLNVLARKR